MQNFLFDFLGKSFDVSRKFPNLGDLSAVWQDREKLEEIIYRALGMPIPKKVIVFIGIFQTEKII